MTGAGRGIGRAIALAYAKAGAVVICAARTESEINDTVKEIQNFGGQSLAVQTDVRDINSVQNLFRATVQEYGGFDILVINAGINEECKTVEESDPEKWRTTLEVNLFGAYVCAHFAIPYLKERGGGKIITIGSGLGHRGIPKNSAYACSKAGLWMLTRVLAQELWAHNISVNELIPGPVQTTLDSQTNGSVSQIDSEWVKKPEDVAPLALFLATQPDVGPSAQSFSLMRRDW